MIDDQSIINFWGWFQENLYDFEMLALGKKGVTTAEVNSKVNSLGDGFVWEVGPNKSGEFQFVISPNGNLERLRLTKKIVSLSPKLEKWSFCSAKPKKEWDRHLELYKNNEKITVNFSEWKYFLTGFDNNSFFDVNFVLKPVSELVNVDFYELAGLFVEAELGEELMMDIIDKINIFNELASDQEYDLTEAVHLYDHLLSVAKT